MNPFNAGRRSFPDFVPSTISCQVFNQPRLLQNGTNTLGDGTWISLSPEFFDTKDFPSKDRHIQPGTHSFFMIWSTKPYGLEFVKNSKVADFCFLPLKLFNNYFLTIQKYFFEEAFAKLSRNGCTVLVFEFCTFSCEAQCNNDSHSLKASSFFFTDEGKPKL